ncbi:hypothetical protein [Streptomyces sp. NPDC059166]|uniref:hypothetical protein n=1 Tax=Streptomyces sp. NPDC059166 TaxID=3346752 RepID=UPI0036C43034
MLYENDDRWFELVHSVLPLANGHGALLDVSEFGKEGERPTTTPPTAVANAPMSGGPPSATMRHRLAYHRDTERGEHEVRASTSRDGVHRSQGSVWALPVRGEPRIGLVSHNRAGATAGSGTCGRTRGGDRGRQFLNPAPVHPHTPSPSGPTEERRLGPAVSSCRQQALIHLLLHIS